MPALAAGDGLPAQAEVILSSRNAGAGSIGSNPTSGFPPSSTHDTETMNAELIPVAQLPALAVEVEEQAHRKLKSLLAKSNWLRDLNEHVSLIAQQSGSTQAKYNRLLRLADRIAADTAPFTACKKGCSECCRIAVPLSAFEAKLIGKAIGQAPAQAPAIADSEDKDRHFGSPCPFLAEGNCSIYAHRPLACRLHVNLSDTPVMCSTSIKPEDSRVPTLGIQSFWAAYSILLLEYPMADIRAFFPEGHAAGKSRRQHASGKR